MIYLGGYLVFSSLSSSPLVVDIMKAELVRSTIAVIHHVVQRVDIDHTTQCT